MQALEPFHVKDQSEWFGFSSRELLLILLSVSCLGAVIVRTNWGSQNLSGYLHADPVIRLAGQRLGGARVQVLEGGVRVRGTGRATEHVLCSIDVPPEQMDRLNEEIRTVVKEKLAEDGAVISTTSEIPTTSSPSARGFHFDYSIGKVIGTVFVQCNYSEPEHARVSFAVVETLR